MHNRNADTCGIVYSSNFVRTYIIIKILTEIYNVQQIIVILMKYWVSVYSDESLARIKREKSWLTENIFYVHININMLGVL